MKREVKLVGCPLRHNGYIVEVLKGKIVEKWLPRR